MSKRTAWFLSPIAVVAADTYSQQFDSETDFKWEKVKLRDGAEAVIIKEYLGKNTTVGIPNQIQGTPVVVIDNRAFCDKQLTSVTIPGSVTQIGDGAFANNKLTSITIPDSVTYIGANAFLNNQLVSLVIPASVGTIGDNAFEANKLTSVTINGNKIGVAAFAENQFTNIKVGDSVSTLEERMFGIASFRNVSQISIGANVSLFARYLRENSIVWADFMNAYHKNEQRAGTYSVSHGNWNFQPR